MARSKVRKQPTETAPVAASTPGLPQGRFRPDHSLPHAFAVVSNRVSTMLHKMYGGKFGLSVTGWRVMAFVANHSPLSAKALSQLTALDQVSISRAVEQLVERKYVSRRVDDADRRRVVLRLTKKGQDAYDEILPVLHAIENALVSALTKDQIRLLRETMDVLKEHSARILPENRDWQSIVASHGHSAAESAGKDIEP